MKEAANEAAKTRRVKRRMERKDRMNVEVARPTIWVLAKLAVVE
jgi:hypothetical protein